LYSCLLISFLLFLVYELALRELVAQGYLVQTSGRPLHIDDGARPQSTFFQEKLCKTRISVLQYLVAGIWALLVKIQALSSN